MISTSTNGSGQFFGPGGLDDQKVVNSQCSCNLLLNAICVTCHINSMPDQNYSRIINNAIIANHSLVLEVTFSQRHVSLSFGQVRSCFLDQMSQQVSVRDKALA